jgi:large subunit ribosomal protein L4
MAKVKLYNQEGKEVGEHKLNDEVFGIAVNPALVHEVLVSIQASERHPYAHTKSRGDVRGGGKKPWRQKGTGRARHGSRRSPIWVGGGITFGPNKDRDYSLKINRKVKQLAMQMCLSDKVAEQKLALVESFGIKDGKTKEYVGLISKLPVEAKKMVLVTADPDKLLRRSTNNVQGVTVRNVNDLGMRDVLDNELVLLTPEAVEKIEKRFTAVKA